jgi:hypothetical protein
VDFHEVRFFGRTSQNSTKVLHFSTWAPSLVSYFKTGLEFAIPGQLQSQVEAFPSDHNASLPNCLSGQTASSANQGNFSLTARPFICGTTNEWNIGNGVGGYWSVDEHDPDNTYATLHQVWVRPSVYWGHAHSTSASVVSGSRLAVMSHPNLTTVYDALTGNGSRDGHQTFSLPFAFKFFSVNYGKDSSKGGMHLADNGYITLGAGSSASSAFTASSPGAGLFLGAADRSLLFYGRTPSQTENDLTYATAVLRFYSNDTGVDEDQVNLEVTFATKGVNQFIEIRAGSISYDDTGNGTWGLSDGYQFLVDNIAMPALYSGQSMVLQSDLQGRYWVPHVNSSLAIRAPPAPSTAEGSAERLRPSPHPLFLPRLRARFSSLGYRRPSPACRLPSHLRPDGPAAPSTHTPARQVPCPRAAWD